MTTPQGADSAAKVNGQVQAPAPDPSDRRNINVQIGSLLSILDAPVDFTASKASA